MSENKKTTKVVIIGGGFGGIKTALNLANKPGFKVQLISDNTRFEYHGALYRSAVGHSPMEVVIPLKDIFKNAKNVELVLDSVGFIDAQKKIIVSLTGNSYRYDKAVFSLGNTVNYFNIKGLEEHTETMHDILSTISLRKKLVELINKGSKTPLRIAIVGAGASGVELAGEIPQFANLVAKKYGNKPPKIQVVLIDGASQILPLLSPKASLKTTRRLKKLGVELHLNILVKSCKNGTLCTNTGELKANLIIWTAGSKPVDFYSVNGSVFTLGRGGRVVVDEYLRAEGQPNIYVIGDNADTRYSGMAQTALSDANFVSRNLIRQKQSKNLKVYRSRKPLYVVTAGPKWAVVEKGNRITSGRRGWTVRRKADLAIFKNFQPYKQALKTWRSGNKLTGLQ